jgi:hypothetical protein
MRTTRPGRREGKTATSPDPFSMRASRVSVLVPQPLQSIGAQLSGSPVL